MLCLAVIGATAAQWFVLLRSPERQLPASIHVTLAPGQSAVLGKNELAAAQADERHLKLRRDANRRWWAANVSAEKKVLYLSGGREESIRSMELKSGTAIRIAAHELQVAAAEAGRLDLADATGSTWRFDGTVLWHQGSPQPACPDQPFQRRLLTWWNRIVPQLLRFERPLTIGGNVFCDNRLALAGIDSGTAQIARDGNRFMLQHGTAESANAAISIVAASANTVQPDLDRREISLEGVTGLIVGRTHFRIEQERETLVLHPVHRVRLYSEPAPPANAAITWHWRANDPWRRLQTGLPLGFWAAGAVYLAAFLLSVIKGWWPWNGKTPLPAAAMFGVAILTAMLGCAGYLMVRQIGVGWYLGLSTIAVACWLATPWRKFSAALVAYLGLSMLAAGLLVQLELGLGAEESHWILYYQRSAALATAALGVGLAVRIAIRYGALRELRFEFLEKVLLAMAIIAGTSLLLQALAGSETGVMGFQPVELAKLALSMFAAHALACRLEWRDNQAYSRASLWLRFLIPVGLFLALVVTALLILRDYSPLVLLAFWLLGVCLAYAIAAGRAWIAIATFTSAACALAAVWLLRHDLSADIAQFGFYPDRFNVWIEPRLHPHTGEQFARAIVAIREGGWFGKTPLGADNGSVMRLPAIHDDFAPVWLMHRHGLASAIVLIVGQVFFVCAMLSTGWRALAWSSIGDYRRAWAGRLAFFLLWGGGFFLLGHFVVSWGTNTGALPVMGQPMPFISVAGSHLLLFVLPLLISSAVIAEEMSP